MYYVYFLITEKRSNWVYVGYTNNIKRRFDEHNQGLNISTKPYIPLKLASYIVVPTKLKAEELENYLKVGSGKAILKKRILTDEALA